MFLLPTNHVSREIRIATQMIRKNPWGDIPIVDESAFVDPSAILCGRVIVNAFVGPYAVIRADEVDAYGHMEPIVPPTELPIHPNAHRVPALSATPGAIAVAATRVATVCDRCGGSS